MKILPMKAFLMEQLLLHPEGLTPTQLLSLAEPVYGREGQCCLKEIDSLMMGMLSVGITEAVRLGKQDGELVVTYGLTASGAENARPVIAAMKGRK